MSVKANIVIDQGATFEAELTITNKDGVVIDVSSYTGRAKMRKHYSSTNAWSFTVDANTSGANGIVTISMDANTTRTLVPGRFVYDLEMVTGNVVSRVLEGQVTVTPEVTR